MVEYYLADVQNQTHKRSLSINKAAMAAVTADNKKKNKPDCRNWLNKGQCARKDNNCSYDHDPQRLAEARREMGGGRSRSKSRGPGGQKGDGKNKKGGKGGGVYGVQDAWSQDRLHLGAWSQDNRSGGHSQPQAKAVVCQQFIAGTCFLGKSCTFSHSEKRIGALYNAFKAGATVAATRSGASPQ